MSKLFKKISALVIAVTMAMAMCIPVGATTASDRGTVKITNLSGKPTVTLYQIVKANYGGTDNASFVDWGYATGLTASDITIAGPTADQINMAARRIAAGTVTPLAVITTGILDTAGTTYSASVGAGAYIAVITGASDNTVYNPIYLTASYDSTGALVAGEVSADSHYLYGTTAVAKSQKPKIDKTVTGATDDTATAGKKIATASVGQELTYTLNPTVPSYPANATNKTFYVTDSMSDGLTFEYSTLTITINGTDVMADANGDFAYGGKVIANAKKLTNGFNLAFIYDNLVYDTVSGAAYSPVVTYKAVVNKNAVVGTEGNPNDANLYYANNPNAGSTYTDIDTPPDTAAGVTKTDNSVTVYTYQLAFHKIGKDAASLAGAVFGIYTDTDCTVLIDQVTTNAQGYALSSQVGAGTYYVKELKAPAGYSLNDTIYTMAADWAAATTTNTSSVTSRNYTSDLTKAISGQIGWMKDGVFYEMSQYASAADGVSAAYLLSEKTSEASSTTLVKNEGAGGTALYGEDIPNTQLSSLPSTGGIGTYLFTIAGAVIMVIAAAIYFSRKKHLLR